MITGIPSSEMGIKDGILEDPEMSDLTSSSRQNNDPTVLWDVWGSSLQDAAGFLLKLLVCDSTSPVLRGGFTFYVSVELVQDRLNNGGHHGSGGCVADPHGQEGRHSHEAQHQPGDKRRGYEDQSSKMIREPGNQEYWKKKVGLNEYSAETRTQYT